MRKYVFIAVGILALLILFIALLPRLFSKNNSAGTNRAIPTPFAGGAQGGMTGNKNQGGYGISSTGAGTGMEKLPAVIQDEMMDDLISKLPIETDDFIITYSSVMDKIVVTRKSPDADNKLSVWGEENGYSDVLDDYTLTLVTNQTVKELDTVLGEPTKSLEETSKEQADLLSGLIDAIMNLPNVFQQKASDYSSSSSSTPENGSSSSTPPSQSTCTNLDSNMAEYTLLYPAGYSGIPRTNNQIYDATGTKNYSIPYRNPACIVTKDVIQKAYERMKTFYPTYWQNTQLLQHWELVQEKAKKYNFNPLFVISLWIEVSGRRSNKRNAVWL
jgi:hypothetical protein